MPFKKGTSGNPIGRPKGSVSATSKLIREHISQAIDGNKIMEMLEFDHFLCITMTKNGPCYSNLMLKGIANKSLEE